MLFLQTRIFSNIINPTIKIRKLTLIHYYHLIFRPHSSFANCPHNVFCKKNKISWELCVAFSYRISLFVRQEFFSVITWRLGSCAFEELGTSYFVKYCSVEVCLVSSWLDSSYVFDETIIRVIPCFPNCILLGGRQFGFVPWLMMLTFISD